MPTKPRSSHSSRSKMFWDDARLVEAIPSASSREDLLSPAVFGTVNGRGSVGLF